MNSLRALATSEPRARTDVDSYLAVRDARPRHFGDRVGYRLGAGASGEDQEQGNPAA